MGKEKHPLLVSKGYKPRTGKIVVCKCGKEFYVRPAAFRPTNYCSRSCYQSLPTTKVTLICKFCEKQYQTYASHVKHRGSSYCSRICLGKYNSINKTGVNSTGWKGGISKEHHRIRQSKEFKDWRISVFTRDNYTCIFCGQHGGYLEPDHIKPFAYFPDLRFDINNGRTLCKPCHKTTDTYGIKAKRLYEHKT